MEEGKCFYSPEASFFLNPGVPSPNWRMLRKLSCRIEGGAAAVGETLGPFPLCLLRNKSLNLQWERQQKLPFFSLVKTYCNWRMEIGNTIHP
jgi:hypothetical protein